MPIGNVSSIFWENARRLCRYMILIQPNHWSDHASTPSKVKKSKDLARSLDRWPQMVYYSTVVNRISRLLACHTCKCSTTFFRVDTWSYQRYVGLAAWYLKRNGQFARKMQTAQFSLHSHSSKNGTPDCFPGVHVMGPIFGVVS